MNPKTRDDKVVNEKLSEVNKRLDELEKMLAGNGFATGSEFTLADCAIAPTMFFAINPLPMFGAKPPRRVELGMRKDFIVHVICVKLLLQLGKWRHRLWRSRLTGAIGVAGGLLTPLGGNPAI